jgi:hypothetical protein
LTESVKSDDIGRLLFDAHALIENVRSASPGTGPEQLQNWSDKVADKGEQIWDQLVQACYKADPESFREVITSIVSNGSDVGSQLIQPGMTEERRTLLVEELMGDFKRAVVPLTDRNGVLLPEAQLSLDRALRAIKSGDKQLLN